MFYFVVVDATPAISFSANFIEGQETYFLVKLLRLQWNLDNSNLKGP